MPEHGRMEIKSMSNALNTTITENQSIEINGIENFHIKHVEVFTCGDDYGPETSGFIVKQYTIDEKTLVVASKKPGRVPGRLRGEPAVRILLTPEYGDLELISLEIYHHKGSIFLKANKENVLQNPELKLV
jgi:hypothetical protein